MQADNGVQISKDVYMSLEDYPVITQKVCACYARVYDSMNWGHMHGRMHIHFH